MNPRLPPHDLDAERAALDCILTSSAECLPVCQERLSGGPLEFYDLRHQAIYSAALEIHEARQGADVTTIQSRLRESGKLHDSGGCAYLSELGGCAASTANLSEYLSIIEGCYLRRQIIAACVSQGKTAYDSPDAIEDILDGFERAALAIRKSGARAAPGIRELVKAAIGNIEAIHQRGGRLEGISTGLVDLDKLSGGLKPGEVTIIAALPGNGKTSLAMNMAEHAVLEEKKRAGVFSLEMSALSLVTRFICSHSRVNLKNLSQGVLRESDFVRLVGAAGKISEAAIWFEDQSGISVYQLAARARRMHQQNAIELLVIDYLQLLSASGGSRKVESRQQEVADISRTVKSLAGELKVPVVALSQLNDEGRLRESRAIGQDADNVWMLEPDDEDNPECAGFHLHIAKARNGPIGRVPLIFIRPFTRFENAATIQPQDDHHGSYHSPHND